MRLGELTSGDALTAIGSWARSKIAGPPWGSGLGLARTLLALFYIFHSVLFGVPPWLNPVLAVVTRIPAGIALMTWGAVALEITLGLALLLPRRLRPLLLTAGLLFHNMIAVSMGLVSFDVAMSAAPLLYLLPIGYQVRAPAWPTKAVSRLADRAPAPPPARPATVTQASAWPERVPRGS
jgi:hypothetical protein